MVLSVSLTEFFDLCIKTLLFCSNVSMLLMLDQTLWAGEQLAMMSLKFMFTMERKQFQQCILSTIKTKISNKYIISCLSILKYSFVHSTLVFRSVNLCLMLKLYHPQGL